MLSLALHDESAPEYVGRGYAVVNSASGGRPGVSMNTRVTSSVYSTVAGTADSWAGSADLVCLDHRPGETVWAAWDRDIDSTFPIGFFVARRANVGNRMSDPDLIGQAMKRADDRRQEQIEQIQQLLDAPIGSLPTDGPF